MAGGPSEAVFLKALNGGRRVGIPYQRHWAVRGGCLHGFRFGVFPAWDNCLLMETVEMQLPRPAGKSSQERRCGCRSGKAQSWMEIQ